MTRPPPISTTPSSLSSSSLSDALNLLQETLGAFTKDVMPDATQQQQQQQREAGSCLRCKKKLIEFYDQKSDKWTMNRQRAPNEHFFLASTLSFDQDTSCSTLIVCAQCALPSEKGIIPVIAETSNEDEYDPSVPDMWQTASTPADDVHLPSPPLPPPKVVEVAV